MRQSMQIYAQFMTKKRQKISFVVVRCIFFQATEFQLSLYFYALLSKVKWARINLNDLMNSKHFPMFLKIWILKYPSL
jgi:hypothetical protein